MMGAAFRLDDAVRPCIDEHLDSIEDVLRGTGMARSERQNILDDIETQIVEMLTARTHGRPTLEDVKAVIAELDPPESYAEHAEDDRKGPRARFSRVAVLGAFWAPFGPILVFLFLFARLHVVAAEAAPPPSMPLGSLLLALTTVPLGLTSPFGTTILGLVSISQIRNSRGKLHGLPLAAADALLYPLLVFGGAASFGLAMLLNGLFDITDVHTLSAALQNSTMWTIAIGLWCTLAGLIVWLVWPAVSKPTDRL